MSPLGRLTREKKSLLLIGLLVVGVAALTLLEGRANKLSSAFGEGFGWGQTITFPSHPSNKHAFRGPPLPRANDLDPTKQGLHLF